MRGRLRAPDARPDALSDLVPVESADQVPHENEPNEVSGDRAQRFSHAAAVQVSDLLPVDAVSVARGPNEVPVADALSDAVPDEREPDDVPF